MRLPSCSSHRYFTVSPPSLTLRTTGVSAGGRPSASRARSALGTLVISAGVGQLLVQAVPHLIEPIARLAVEQRGELVAASGAYSGVVTRPRRPASSYWSM